MRGDDRIPTIGEAVRAVTGDPTWVKKVAIGVALNLIPYVGAFWLAGYMLAFMRDAAWKPSAPLPEWQPVAQRLKTGLIAFLVSLVLSIPLSVLAAALVVVLASVGVAALAAGPDPLPVILISLFAFTLLMVASVAYAVLIRPALVHVALYDTMEAAFDFKRVYELARSNASAFWPAFRRALAVSMASGLAVTLLIAAVGLAAFAMFAAEPTAETMALASVLILPLEFVVIAVSGFVAVPLGLASDRVWAGYARIAYGLGDAQPVPGAPAAG